MTARPAPSSLLLLIAATSCGGAQTAKPSETSAASTSSPPAAPSGATTEPATASAISPPADSAAAPEATGAPETSAPPLKGHDITYRMTSSGLVIEVDGLVLEPKAEPMKSGGGWGVKLSVRTKAADGKQHRLLSPASGPLMVAEIDRGSGQKERIADERKGDSDAFITAGDEMPLERKLAKPIFAGQSLTLYVGLWGIGREDGERKPIKKLLVVKMVAGQKTPQPVITAPE